MHISWLKFFPIIEILLYLCLILSLCAQVTSKDLPECQVYNSSLWSSIIGQEAEWPEDWKKSPNFLCGQNCGQNIKNQIKNAKQIHPSATQCLNKYSQLCSWAALSGKNVKSAQVKVAKWQYMIMIFDQLALFASMTTSLLHS